MRVSEEAVDLLVELLTAAADKIAVESASVAVEDGRNTIMANTPSVWRDARWRIRWAQSRDELANIVWQ